MVEFVAGIIDQIRTSSLHHWLARLALGFAGATLIGVCWLSTGATLSGTTPVISSVLLLTVMIWPESLATIAFLAFAAVWWILAWKGPIQATVAVAALVGLVHVLAAVVVGPPHGVVRGDAVAAVGRRIAAYLVAVVIVGAGVAALSSGHLPRAVAWVAVVLVSLGMLVATLVAGMTDEAAQADEEILDDEPFLPDELR